MRTAELSAYAESLNLQPTRRATEEEQAHLPRLQRREGSSYDGAMLHRMRRQGFDFDTETDNRTKFGPESLFDGLARYFEDKPWEPDWKAIKKALKATYSAFARPMDAEYLEPWHPTLVQEKLHLSASAGLPSMKPKGEVLDEEWKLAEMWGNRLLSSGRLRGIRPSPCVPFHRGGFGEDGPRIRLVWGYPCSMILFEGAFSGPLYELFQWDLQSPMAFGQHKSYVRGVMHSLERYNTRVGLDSSRFDSSLNPWIINRMFDVLETWFAPKHRVFFKLIRHYFVNTPILMPDGNVYVTKRGVPSGSEFTQWIDSAATYFLVQYAMYRTTNRTVPYGSLLVLGDDAAFGTNESVQPMEFASAMWELGVTMNVEKTVFARRGSPCHFLGHEWLRGFMTRPVEEIAQRAVFPERNATLRDAHWFTRLFSICMSCDNGLAFLMNMFGFHHIGQLYLVPLPGRRPLSGLEAANARGDPGPEHGVVGNLPWTLPRS